MTSQFDALLSFGDDTPPTTNGTTQKASETDDFDPFGPGLSVEGKGTAGDSALLLDFTVSTEVNNKTENGNADPFEAQFTVTTSTDENDSSANLLYDMSTADTESSSVNPLYDMSSAQSANPLYDLLDEDMASEGQQRGQGSNSENLLYDFSTNNNADFLIETSTTDTSASANPLYDLRDDEAQPDQQQEEEEEEIRVAVTSEVEATPRSGAGEEDFEVEAGGSYLDDEQVVPAEPEPGESTQNRYQYEEESFDQHVELYIKEDGDDTVPEVAAAAVSAAVDVADAAGDDGDADSTKGRRRSRSRSPSRSRSRSRSISSEREVLNEEEEMRQDGRTVYRSHEEQSFSETRSDGHPPQQLIDSGFGSSSMMREEFSASGAGGLQNGEQARDSNVAREERQREDFHFTEMSSVKNQFERGPGPTPAPRRAVDVRAEVAYAEGGVYESQPTTFEPQWQEETEEGVYENEPVQRGDVVKESDRNIAAELPAVGMARNIRERFQSGKVESSTGVKREVTPPVAAYGGVYENQPQYNPDVVHSGEDLQEELPEQGTARNLAAKFKQMEKQGGVPSPATQGRRELTPDRAGRVEYVSEPRGHIERYEGQSEAGVFESQPAERPDVVKSDQQLEELLPERGTAKNIAQQFRQMSTSGGSTASPRAKREITPDTSGKMEYVSEPRGFIETYEGRAESGVFESQPVDRDDVVKSDQLPDEVLPERGVARNIAAKFREMESAMKSPPQSPSRRKEFTPPRDDTDRTVAGVVENTPTVSSDVVHSGEQVEEVLPERGTAKSLANRFKQMGSTSSSAGQSPRPKKEFTPPPAECGVFENNPQQFVPDYNPPAESGIIESHPQQRADVVKGDDGPNYEQELPERGFARNLVSAWRQRESENVKGSPTGSAKLKEFTPPREEPRVAQQRSSACRTPKSPLAGQGPLNEGSIHPSDLPDQYQRQDEPSVYESQPEHLEGVVSEQDTDWTEGLPKKDTTKKMLAKFRHIQSEATKESPRPAPSGKKAQNIRR